MKKNIPIILFVFIISLGSISAQTFVGKINPFPTGAITRTTSEDTLKLLAVLVEFNEDDDDATFGDGKFGSIYTSDYGTDIIDPLPHDAAYFEDHLLFAKNYFEKVSGGKLIVDYTVLDKIIELPLIMRDYSPNPNDPDNFLPLADFCKEVWESADQKFSIDFSDYDLFTIFHAGVGRDIQVPGSIGNERDLPSVYLSPAAFTEIYGEGFEGFSVNEGSYSIMNSMILPETESRELTSFDETSLIQLSINGLIAGSIASYLGLPDLFDTNTGLSAIGRFGLMDGQSLFTFSGLFPPEPSPWEKLYLGWTDYITINASANSVGLIAESAAEIGDTALIKVPINSSEYFLIENRSRDAKNDGCTITYKKAGQTFTKMFDKDYASFISYNVDTLSGVVIDVDEYDWAVPPFDRNDDDLEEFSDVGIVIWHIDESVINENLESNTINNDIFRRGVAVVEADGINDIGEEFQTILGDIVIGEGSKEDTWYASNPSEYFENKFNDDTKPSTNSNTGANSLISISNFSEIGTKMSFDISFGTNDVYQIAAVELPGTGDTKWLNSVQIETNETFFFSSSSEFVTSDLNAQSFESFSSTMDFRPVSFRLDETTNILYSDGRNINRYYFRNNFKSFATLRDSIMITTPFAVKGISDKAEFVYGNADGYVNVCELLSDGFGTINGIALYKAFDDTVKQVAVNNDYLAAIGGDSYWDINSGELSLPANAESLALTMLNDDYVSIVLMEDNTIAVIKSGVVSETISIDSDVDVVGISLADLKADGSNYIVVNTGTQIDAFNLEGGRAEYFPIECPEDTEFTNVPLAIDINDDSYSDLITLTEDGRIFVLSGSDGASISPFPLSIGTKTAADPLIYSNGETTKLVVVDENNELHLWSLSNGAHNVNWAGTLANSWNTSFTSAAGTVNVVNEYFPTAKAYNWPNPVYEGKTYFRFYVSEDSQTEINIFDLAGDLVEKLNVNASGGFDNEIEWDVSDVQSGVYFAHLHVEGNSGKSAYKIIKVAVIK